MSFFLFFFFFATVSSVSTGSGGRDRFSARFFAIFSASSAAAAASSEDGKGESALFELFCICLLLHKNEDVSRPIRHQARGRILQREDERALSLGREQKALNRAPAKKERKKQQFESRRTIRRAFDRFFREESLRRFLSFLLSMKNRRGFRGRKATFRARLRGRIRKVQLFLGICFRESFRGVFSGPRRSNRSFRGGRKGFLSGRR